MYWKDLYSNLKSALSKYELDKVKITIYNNILTY